MSPASEGEPDTVTTYSALPAESSDEVVFPRIFDESQSRIVFRGIGNRWDGWLEESAPDTAMLLRKAKKSRRPVHHKNQGELSEGDWNWNVGGSVNSAVALFDPAAAWTATSVSCAARLMVGADRNSGSDLYVFDTLVKKGSDGACTEPSHPSACTPSAAPESHCPRLLGSLSLNGTVRRSGIALSLDGGTAYVTTSTGYLYAIKVAVTPPAAPTVAWSYRPTTGSYVGVAPWVDYSTGNVIATLAVSSGTTVMKFRPTDTTPWQTATLADTVSASPIEYNGYLYVPCANGKIHRLQDTPAGWIAADTGAWPVQLKATTGNTDANHDTIPEPDQAASILAHPTIDGSASTLFAVVRNTLWAVKLGGPTDGRLDYVEMGWQNKAQAEANDVDAYSAPSIVWGATRVLLIAHGKAQDTPSNRLHRRYYDADGILDKVNLSSAEVVGQNSNDMSAPRSTAVGIPNPGDGRVYAYVGDGGGYLNKFQLTTATPPELGTRTTFNSGSAIESPVLVDFMGGNIYFGNTNGRVYQISQITLR